MPDGNCLFAALSLLTRPLTSTQFELLKSGNSGAEELITPEMVYGISRA